MGEVSEAEARGGATRRGVNAHARRDNRHAGARALLERCLLLVDGHLLALFLQVCLLTKILKSQWLSIFIK
jgi:hypothetical protein